MRPGGPAPREPEPADAAGFLDRRDWAALALVAALVLMNQAVVQPPLARLATDAPVINLAGRQRMLSQRIAKAALALHLDPGGPASAARRDELGDALGRWTAAHERLAADPANSDAVRAAFRDLDPHYRRMRDAATRRLEGGGGTTSVLDSEPQYLARMETVVGLYEQEARGRVSRLTRLGWGLTAAVLAALAGIDLFLLRPASRTIARQIVALGAARDELEQRVRERTGELERANRDLAREARERTRAEERHRSLVEQFSHVARTTAVGEMAGGLAHELNQPLGAIANYAEGCLVTLDDGAGPSKLVEVRAAVEKILAATLRAGAIVKRIRRFVTRQASIRERFDPTRLVLDVEEFVRDEAARRGVALRAEPAPGLPYLNGDPVQLQQVLVNLLRNAFDALDAAKAPSPLVVMATEPGPEGGVGFAVTDNGEGIPGDRLARVFDAYFSTRAEGMGMGLAISRTIIEAHQGRIGVESTPGIRTTFRFTLPAGDGGVGGGTNDEAGDRDDDDPAGADRLRR